MFKSVDGQDRRIANAIEGRSDETLIEELKGARTVRIREQTARRKSPESKIREIKEDDESGNPRNQIASEIRDDGSLGPQDLSEFEGM